jgi:hypothetical protein
MKKQSVLSTVIIAGISAFAVTTQAADPPPACQDTQGRRGYSAGYLAGTSLTRQAWAGVKDCDRIEEFEGVILDTLDRLRPPTKPSTYFSCRYAGTVAGMIDQIDPLYKTCTDTCQEEGEIIGKVSAIAYCELAIALGGLPSADAFLRQPVLLCGFAFQTGCDAMFVSASTVYFNDQGSCQPYTVNPFLTVWSQVRTNQCAYWPTPPDSGHDDDKKP